jgi:hypothetical protein
MLAQSIQGLHHSFFSLNANIVDHDFISCFPTAYRPRPPIS